MGECRSGVAGIKLSEWPVGTNIYIKPHGTYTRDRLGWKSDAYSNYLTISTVDGLQADGENVEILGVPLSVVNRLVKSMQELMESWGHDYFEDEEIDSDHILREAIEEVKKEEL